LPERSRFRGKDRDQIRFFAQQLFHFVALLSRARASCKSGDLFPKLGWDRGRSTSAHFLGRPFQELEQDFEIIIHRRRLERAAELAKK
jgi:hypothetical protein